MRITTVAGILLATLALTSCSADQPTSTPPTPPANSTASATTAPAPTPTGDVATIAAVKEAAPRLRAANGIVQGCLVDVTPTCVAAVTDQAVPAANSLAVALGNAPGETATVMADVTSLAASLAGVNDTAIAYQADKSAAHWSQVVLALGGVVDMLDLDWAARGA